MAELEAGQTVYWQRRALSAETERDRLAEENAAKDGEIERCAEERDEAREANRRMVQNEGSYQRRYFGEKARGDRLAEENAAKDRAIERLRAALEQASERIAAMDVALTEDPLRVTQEAYFGTREIAAALAREEGSG